MQSRCWVVTADERAGRLVRVDRTPGGHLHATGIDEIEDAWEEHEHGRPSPRSGKNGHTYASSGHEDDTRRARFAKSVATWLEPLIATHAIDRVCLFAPPRFLGALRNSWSTQLESCVDEHATDLAPVAIADLARSHAVIDAMNPTGR